MLAYLILWRETELDHFTEEEVPQGELTATEINPKIYHDIQVILSRLIAKAE